MLKNHCVKRNWPNLRSPTRYLRIMVLTWRSWKSKKCIIIKKNYKRPKLSTLEYNNSPKYHWIPSTNTETTARYVESVKNLALSILGLWLAGSALLAQSAEKTFIGHSHKCKEAPETIKQHGYVETHIPNSSKLSTSIT